MCAVVSVRVGLNECVRAALNYEPASLDQRFMEWLKKRNSTKEYLASLNLLGNMNPLSKTYPSNSGETKVCLPVTSCGVWRVVSVVSVVSVVCRVCRVCCVSCRVVSCDNIVHAKQYGAESLAIDKYGMNLMNPVCSATIILEAISGTTTHALTRTGAQANTTSGPTQR